MESKHITTIHRGRTTIPTTILLLLVVVVVSPGTVQASGGTVTGGQTGREGKVPRPHLSVGQNSTFCKMTTSILHCDYQWRDQEVTLDDRSAGRSTSILLQRLHHLTLHRSVCLHLGLRNVGDARVEGDPSTSCSRMNLNLLNVTLDLLAEPFTSVHAQDSRIGELSLGNLEEQLTLIGSSVGVLEVGRVRGDGRVSVKIHSTSVSRLESLKVDQSAKVLLHDSVIGDVPRGALSLASRGNSFNKIKFPAKSDRSPAVLELLPGADVTLEDVSGRVTVVAALSASSSTTTTGLSNTPQHTSPPPDTLHHPQPLDCSQYNLYIVLLALSLAFNGIMICCVLIARCSVHQPQGVPTGEKCEPLVDQVTCPSGR